VVVVLIYRFLSFWLPSLLGFPLILTLRRISALDGRPAQEGDPV
jgi:uncharacterized membrane protein YbhN (UPF0104 family)